MNGMTIMDGCLMLEWRGLGLFEVLNEGGKSCIGCPINWSSIELWNATF